MRRAGIDSLQAALSQIRSNPIDLPRPPQHRLTSPQQETSYAISESTLLLMENAVTAINEEVLITPELLADSQLFLEHGEANQLTYELEIEREHRILVRPTTRLDCSSWDNHFVDTYDSSGRFRVRVKNGQPRLTIKLPLLSHVMSPDEKMCIRLELKPTTQDQVIEILQLQQVISQELGSRVLQKKGTKIELKNGQEVWLNTNRRQFWIEYDGDEDLSTLLPDYLALAAQHEPSNVELSPYERRFLIYKNQYWKNLSATSRTFQGKIDTSVSPEKKALMADDERVRQQAIDNQKVVLEFIWQNRNRNFDSAMEVLQFIWDIAYRVNKDLVEEPVAYRTWPVKYGPQLPAEKVPQEMVNFAQKIYQYVQKPKENGQAIKLAAWLEVVLDRQIHAFADGCGRVAKALSAWALMRYQLPLPDYEDRDQYYQAMNTSNEAFWAYYRQAWKKGRSAWTR